ncbi:MAG: SocA family protein [Methanomicrobiales archaeon]|nr:SocA family protein [Methanomicrobiales archaeon]
MKTEKQVNSLLYAIEKFPDIGRVKLMKFVFFVDLVMHYRRNETLLEDEYIRMPFGPVPAIAFTLTAQTNEFFAVSKTMIGYEKIQYVFKPLQSADMSLFTQEETGVLDGVLDILRKNTAVAVSTLTHRFDLWKRVANGYRIPLDLFKLKENELTGHDREILVMNDNVCDPGLEPVPCGVREMPVTALMSERSLAKDWLKPEEDKAWDYL